MNCAIAFELRVEPGQDAALYEDACRKVREIILSAKQPQIDEL
jgi:hypothetical protein